MNVAFSCHMSHMNLTELLDKTASRWPEKTALIEGDTIVSYADLVQKIAELASRLQTLQLKSGCRVGLCLPNSISYVALTFALWRINAVVVPIPTECTDEEFSNIAETMRLEAIISQKPRGQSAPLSADCFFTKLYSANAAGQSRIEHRLHPVHFRHDQRLQRSCVKPRNHPRPRRGFQ